MNKIFVSLSIVVCLFCISCNDTIKQVEIQFGVIEDINYKNNYLDGKLQSVDVEWITSEYNRGNVVNKDIKNVNNKYHYSSSEEYKISSNELGDDKHYIEYHSPLSLEQYTLTSNGDTIDYYNREYIEYIGEKRLSSLRKKSTLNSVAFDLFVNDNYKEYYTHNDMGQVSKKRHYNYDDKSWTSTYFFYDIPYSEVCKSDLDSPRTIINYITNIHGDTTVITKYENGEMFSINKEYIDNNKKVCSYYDGIGDFLFEEVSYTKNDTTYMVLNTPMFEQNNKFNVDSTYIINENIVREVQISEGDKTTITNEYDSKGNILKKRSVIEFSDV